MGLRTNLGNFGKGARADFGIGGEDAREAGRLARALEGKQAEAPKMEQMGAAWHLGGRIRDLANVGPEGILKSTIPGRIARDELQMGLASEPWEKAGQMAGAVGGDIAQDGFRRFYWLLNAMQAAGEVINEQVLARANKKLYGRSPVMNAANGGMQLPLQVKDKTQAIAQGAARVNPNDPEKIIANRGYSITPEGNFEKRNFEPGYIQALSIPTGIAINSGLGLLTPFGGAEGYKAAIPSEEDPSKTDNMIGEVALKYIMGRTGQLLPFDEFKKVRPDVSKNEYMRYKAFKHDKQEDWDPTDGDLTLGAGAIKFTDEGIHGPEVQFLGRGLPVTTGIVPFASALAGGALGVRRDKAIRGGFFGGLGGLVAGQIAGNLLEQERRRRNTAANEMSSPATLVG